MVSSLAVLLREPVSGREGLSFRCMPRGDKTAPAEPMRAMRRGRLSRFSPFGDHEARSRHGGHASKRRQALTLRTHPACSTSSQASDSQRGDALERAARAAARGSLSSPAPDRLLHRRLRVDRASARRRDRRLDSPRRRARAARRGSAASARSSRLARAAARRGARRDRVRGGARARSGRAPSSALGAGRDHVSRSRERGRAHSRELLEHFFGRATGGENRLDLGARRKAPIARARHERGEKCLRGNATRHRSRLPRLRVGTRRRAD